MTKLNAIILTLAAVAAVNANAQPGDPCKAGGGMW